MGEKMSSEQNKVIPINDDSNFSTTTGKVLEVFDGYYEVSVFNSPVKAQKAFSCIIDPVPEDTVICCKSDNAFYILGIIERKNNNKSHISFPSDTNIETKSGSLNLFSKESVSIVSHDLNCFSKKAIHKSEDATICYRNLTATGETLTGTFRTVKFISSLINTMAKNVFERFKFYNRNTEVIDQIQAGQIGRKTDGSYMLDSTHTILNSKECTKIDGEKILMG